MATLKRVRFAATSEAYTGEQQRLLFETVETDLEALQTEIYKVTPEVADQREQQQPKRAPLPAGLPRKVITHEPVSTTRRCGCQLQHIGEYVDYSGYKTLLRAGVTEAGCMAHVRHKFHELWANHKSQIAEDVVKLFSVLYDIERQG